jgi:hypothetical protein
MLWLIVRTENEDLVVAATTGMRIEPAKQGHPYPEETGEETVELPLFRSSHFTSNIHNSLAVKRVKYKWINYQRGDREPRSQPRQ